jgi:hypothetical protein
LVSLEDVVAVTAAGTDRTRSDEVIGALVRMAAVDGGGEADAVLLVLHLLSPGVAAMAARYAGLCPDLMAAIVSELAARIVSFPWRRRHRAVAANLLLDTRSSILRELCPRRMRGSRDGEDIPVDPDEAFWGTRDLPVPGPGQDEDVDLGDLLAWAAREGVACREDLRLLVELEIGREQPGGPRLRAAAEHGINEKTVRRRRDRTLQALREARGQYLSAVA